jgi:SEC-C motif-containing protein
MAARHAGVGSHSTMFNAVQGEHTAGVSPKRCPCGTGLPYADCCGRLHDGTHAAATAEQLMRSRYSAFVVGDPAYLLATWHPRTRPGSLELDPDVRWTGLEIVATSGGSMLDTEGTVEFRAHRVDGVQSERSRFRRENGRWFYLDGVHA